jgi:hypothetical protein
MATLHHNSNERSVVVADGDRLVDMGVEDGLEVGSCAFVTDGLEIAIGLWVVTPCTCGILLDGVTGTCQGRCDGSECTMDSE